MHLVLLNINHTSYPPCYPSIIMCSPNNRLADAHHATFHPQTFTRLCTAIHSKYHDRVASKPSFFSFSSICGSSSLSNSLPEYTVSQYIQIFAHQYPTPRPFQMAENYPFTLFPSLQHTVFCTPLSQPRRPANEQLPIQQSYKGRHPHIHKDRDKTHSSTRKTSNARLLHPDDDTRKSTEQLPRTQRRVLQQRKVDKPDTCYHRKRRYRAR